MELGIFFSTFGLIFLAEVGDKTQLATMALAMRYPWQKVFCGAAAAFVLLNLGAVALGRLLFLHLPLHWVQLAAAALFGVLGICLLRTPATTSVEAPAGRVRAPLLHSFLLILAAELGDKTQLATASVAAQYDAPITVCAGSTLALWAVALLGIFAGRRLTRVVPLAVLHKTAGALFLIFALTSLVQALH